MRAQSDIEMSIREHLPVLFGKTAVVSGDEYNEKLEDLIEHASSASEPFLGAETLRYQSILLYASLILASVNIFKLSKVKIGDSFVSVDKHLLLIYAGFLAGIALMFLLKVFIDYERVKLRREKRAGAIIKIHELNISAIHIRTVQAHFWKMLSDRIRRAYQTYREVYSEAKGETIDRSIMQSVTPLPDLTTLAREPGLRIEIEANERVIEKFSAQIDEDERQFISAAREILLSDAPDPNDLVFGHLRKAMRIGESFDTTLQPWVEACSKLSWEALSSVSESVDVLRMNSLVSVIKKIDRIQWIYAAVEVLGPFALALAAIIYVLSAPPLVLFHNYAWV